MEPPQSQPVINRVRVQNVKIIEGFFLLLVLTSELKWCKTKQSGSRSSWNKQPPASGLALSPAFLQISAGHTELKDVLLQAERHREHTSNAAHRRRHVQHKNTYLLGHKTIWAQQAD